jgi:CubicO group peptidase (beta-lactamase class C family)
MPAAPALAAPLPPSTATDVGLDPAGLEAHAKAVQAFVDAGDLPGAVILVGRRGRIADARVINSATPVGRPLQRDTLFRAYSMTKPVTAVAMMILYEEGRWKPSDPVSQHIPQFKGLKVWTGTDAEGRPILQAPAHEPTMGELLTMTAGFSYGIFTPEPVDKLYDAADLWHAKTLDQFIGKVAALPLANPPGARWRYAVGPDIEGYIVEKLSGQSLPAFYEKRIFKPLGMGDTAFVLAGAKAARLATLTETAGKGKLTARGEFLGSGYDGSGAPFAGAGLLTTADDYARFAQMLLNKGELDGRRVLKASSVAMIMSNHLAAPLRDGTAGPPDKKFGPGLGFGYNGAVWDDPPKAGSPMGKGSYGWDGLATTWFWVDPTNDLFVVGMSQTLANPIVFGVSATSRGTLYQAVAGSGAKSAAPAAAH